MSSLLLEVVEMLGGTIAKVVPITIVPALVFSVLGAGVVFNIMTPTRLLGPGLQFVHLLWSDYPNLSGQLSNLDLVPGYPVSSGFAGVRTR